MIFHYLCTPFVLWTWGLTSVQSFSTTLAPPAIPSVLHVPPPAELPSSVATDLAKDGIAIVPNYACPDTVALLQFDALRSQHAGLVHAAGTIQENAKKKKDKNEHESIGDDEVDPYRKCDHFWLSGKKYVGPSYLLDLVSTIEDEVDGTSPFSMGPNNNLSDIGEGENDDSHTIHRHETEVAYLYYDAGGYFNWHFDTPDAAATEHSTKSDDKKSQSHRRAFSFLLYLGGHEPDPKTGDVSPWNAERDGGELRVYPRLSLEDQHKRIHGEENEDINMETSLSDTQSGGNGDDVGILGDPTGRTDFTDIVPHEGTLVIFKSEAICHEVLTTNRERLAVVGWIHGDLE